MSNKRKEKSRPSSPFAYKSFVGRTLVQQKTGEAFHIIGYVGTHQFIVKQDGLDVDMFIPVKKLHHYVMMPAPEISDDELACMDDDPIA